MKRVLFALPLAALAACSSHDSTDKDVLMKCDFDVLNGWLPDRTDLTRDKAHSGSYCLKVDQGREFTLSYSATLGQLSTTRIRGVRFDGWAFMTDKNSTASVALITKESLTGNDISKIYLDFGTMKEYGKWVPISKEIIFPPNTNYNSAVAFYLWRSSASSPAYLDDVQLTALR